MQATGRCGVLLDYATSFDRVPRDIALRTLEALGLDQGVLRALRGFYNSSVRLFKVGI